MNAIEHQATVDKGLKMKIKRKNISGGSPKNTDLPKAGGTEPTNGGTANGNSTNGSSAALDKLKQTLAADKERFLNNSKQQQQQQATSGTTTMTNGAPTPSARSGPPGCNKRACKDSKVVVMVNKDGTTGGTAVPAGTTSITSGTGEANGGATSGANGGATGATSGSVAELSKSGAAMNAVKKECLSTSCNSSTTTTTSDPYEFNAKVEDRIGLPVKKIKIEKLENPTSPGATHSDMDLHDIGTETCSVAIATDPDCLGPCEPGTSVVLEGIVWNETENGILVVNVTWRGKTYVGTLMDTTKHAWAPPRLNCDSPANEEGTHTPRGRGKRGGRNAVTPPVVELGERRLRKRRTNNNNPYAATAPSPAKSDVLGGIKRRGRPTDFDLSLDNLRQIKRPRVAKNGVVNHHHGAVTLENGFIECPEPNCMKKYKHINGLKYHQAHAHKKYCNEDQEQESPDSNKRATPDGVDEDERVFQDLPGSPSAWCQGGAKKEAAGGGAGGGAGAEQDFKSDGVKGKKSARKEDKIDARKLAKRPTVELTPVSVDAKTGVYPSTVSSPSSVTTVSVLPSTAGTRCTATTSITTMPITTATTSSSGDKVKKSKADKKSKHRLQQMAPASGLKPIQPRPTVLGETGSVNPLVGLKEKKSKKKKNKDKDKDREHRGSSEKSAEHKTKDVSKPAEVCASSASELSVSLGGSKPLEALAKMSTPPELQKQANLSPPELQKQPSLVSTSPALMKAPDARPPSSLSLNSPVADTGTGESKDQNTNAQSPAYSDISDANDSSTNLDADTGTAATGAAAIKKEPQLQERHSGQDGAMKTGATPSSVTCGGGGDHVPQNYHASVYHAGYYPPHSYQSPSTSSPQHQTSRDGRTGGGGGGGSGGGGCAPSASKPQGKESDKCLKASDAGKKAEHRDGKDPSKAAAPKPSPSPVQIREYQEQMLRAQQMAQYQQYLGAYGYGVDVRALASNPEYKAQYEWMMEQERVRREYLAEHQKLAAGKNAENGAAPGGGKPKAHDPSRPLDLNTKAMDLSKQGKSSPSPRSNATAPPSGAEQYKQTDGMTPKAKDSGMAPTSDSKVCDSSKEAKSHVDHRGGAGAGAGASYPPGFDRCQEEYKRYFMYQQQHLLEQKHYMDGADNKQTPPSPHHRDTASATTHSMTPSPHHQHQSSGSYPREAMSSAGKLPSHPTQHQEYRQTEAKSDKERCKTTTSSAPPASNSLPPSPAGKLKDSSPYGQYYSHSGYAGYPGYEQLGYAQNHIMLGYVSGSSNYSTPSPYGNKSRCQSPALASKGSSLPEGTKALELLQQKAANYYNSQSPQSQHPKQPVVKDNPKPDKAGSDRQSQDRVGLDWVGTERTGADHPDQRNKDKELDHKSPPPPTQRHIHTHHHTHLVGPAYPLYGPYSALMASQKATAAAAAAAVSYGPTK